MSLSINGIGQNIGNYAGGSYDSKEVEVARKLGMSIEEFSKLSESEKKQKVEEYNATHPNNPIQDKQYRQQNQQTQGATMSSFMQDVDWEKIKLQR